MTREERFDKARRALAHNGYACSELRGLRFTATHESGCEIKAELRPRMWIIRDNMGLGVYMCFPIGRHHYLIPHDRMVEIVGENLTALSTLSWRRGGYNWRSPSQRTRQALSQFRLDAPNDCH